MMVPPRTGEGRRWSGKTKGPSEFSPRAAAVGVLWALGLAVLLAGVASGVVYVTDMDDRVLAWVVDLGSFLILGLVALSTARRQGHHGLAYGLSIGGAYAVLSLLVGALLFPPFVGFVQASKRLGFSVLSGAIGGILGVNS